MYRLVRGCLALIGLAVVTFVALMVYGAMHQNQPATVNVNVTTTSSPAAAAPSSLPPSAAPSAAPPVDQRIAATEARIRQDAATGKHEPISMTISDAELNSLIQEAIASGQVQAPVTNIQAASVPGQVNISGQAHAGILNAPFTMTALPKVSNGKAQLEVSGMNFSGVPVPQAISSQVSSAVSSDDLLRGLPVTVTSFRAEQGQLVMQGTT